jgi:hypothetical protein
VKPELKAAIALAEFGSRRGGDNRAWLKLAENVNVHVRYKEDVTEAAARIILARVRELEGHVKRLVEAGNEMQSAIVGEEGMSDWQWLAAAYEADAKWRKVKELLQ